jgi:hypothetical protein
LVGRRLTWSRERMSQAPIVMIGCAVLALFDFSFYTSKALFDLFMSLPASRKHEVHLL